MPSLKYLVEQAEIPGISIATFGKGDGVQTEVQGTRKTGEDDEKINTETVFEAASLSKPVFAYIVIKLAERGIIDLKKSLCEYTSKFGPPNLRGAAEHSALTASNILSHQAGLPNGFESQFLATPNSRFDYSGFAYCFLHDVIEEITGEKFDDLTREILGNIGMTSSCYYYPESSETNIAVGHSETGNPDINPHFERKSEKTHPIHPGASLYTTAEDYTKFLQACVKDKYVSKIMFNDPKVRVELAGNDVKGQIAGVPDEYMEKLSWGLGIGIQRNSDQSMTLFHWGDNATFRNFTAVRLNKNGSARGGVTCLINSANGPAVFRAVAEPVVGDIEAIAQWLSIREKLNVKISSPTTSSKLITPGYYRHTQSSFAKVKDKQESDFPSPPSKNKLVKP